MSERGIDMAWNPEKATDSFLLRLRNKKYTFWKAVGFIAANTLLSYGLGYWVGYLAGKAVQ